MARANGHHRVGQLMSAQTDLAIFHKFLGPNAISLSFLEAEIIHIYDDLQFEIKEDRKSGNPERFQLERCFALLKASTESPEGCAQYEKVMEMRKLLKEHRETLLTFKEVCSLPPAEPDALDALRAWFRADEGRRFLGCHAENSARDETMEFDLTSLTGRYHDSDLLSRFIDGTILTWLHDKVLHKHRKPVELYDSLSRTVVQEEVYNYSQSALSRMVGLLSMTLASLIPAVSIFALFFITSPIARLAAIVGFTLLFSTAVMLITAAKRSECFAVTSAFAAVLVVFINNNNSSNSGSGCSC